ncbi:MAG: ABC transporter ATP-binding protein [Pseudomonadota bacterium]
MSEAQHSIILSIEQLCFDYPGRPVLQELDLALQHGELFALLGPNGAGKSTLIRALCGRLRPHKGSIQVSGLDPHRSAAARKSIGLVPQQIALYRHLTVFENLEVFARLAGVQRVRVSALAQQALDQCGLESVAGQIVSELSGGWQRRANIACGLVHEPALLVLDEPTVGIDLPARLAIEQLLTELSGQGMTQQMTILLISHDLEQVERLADRVGFLINGRMQHVGVPIELLSQQFGQMHEWHVQLEQKPNAADSELLNRLELQPEPAAGQLYWRGWLDEAQQAGARMQRLEQAQIAVREWRVRQPGLDSLWRTVYGMAQPESIDQTNEALAR